MLLKLIAVGRLKDRALAGKCADYIRRLTGGGRKFELVELPDSGVESEGDAMLRELDRERHSAIVVLTEEGREFSSLELAQWLRKLDRKAVFIIGGPFGIAPAVKRRADLLWSLSRLTFPHEIARLLCVEQLYRAADIARGGSYHHQ